MNRCESWCNSSIALKSIMAFTGLALVGFVLVHLSGHFLIFLGPEAINAYAQKLADLGVLLWFARAGLLLIFSVHIGCALKLQAENKKARPVRYQRPGVVQASYASLTMIYSGLLVLAFVIYHLAHFTFHWLDIKSIGVDLAGNKDVYTMLISSFSNPVVAGTYVLAVMVLGLHLSHGLSSMFQTLGFSDEGIWPRIELAGKLIAVLITLGYISVPLAVLLGLV